MIIQFLLKLMFVWMVFLESREKCGKSFAAPFTVPVVGAWNWNQRYAYVPLATRKIELIEERKLFRKDFRFYIDQQRFEGEHFIREPSSAQRLMFIPPSTLVVSHCLTVVIHLNDFLEYIFGYTKATTVQTRSPRRE